MRTYRISVISKSAVKSVAAYYLWFRGTSTQGRIQVATASLHNIVTFFESRVTGRRARFRHPETETSPIQRRILRIAADPKCFPIR